jgi:hypothetical protein
LQYATLENLLQHKTVYAFTIFRDILNTDPPVLEPDETASDYTGYPSLSSLRNIRRYHYNNGSFLDELSDSIKLTRVILPDLLSLLNLEDYKSSIMKLLGEMIDSNLVMPKDYEIYFSKFLIEARQELKKQSIAEKKKAIKKAEESKEEKKISAYYSHEGDKDAGNDDLSLYATLLLPFWETNPAVQRLILQMLQSEDKQLKYRTMLLLLHHNKPFPDSLPGYFGSLDEYRYPLYRDLKQHCTTTILTWAEAHYRIKKRMASLIQSCLLTGSVQNTMTKMDLSISINTRLKKTTWHGNWRWWAWYPGTRNNLNLKTV